MQYMPGNKPTEEAVRELKAFLSLHLNKPGGITISVEEAAPSADSVLSVQAVKAIEDRNRKRHTTDSLLSVYVLFTDGHSSNKDQLGFAYRNTSAVLFGKHIAEHSGKFKKPGRADLESRVLQHEFGHLLGLINTASDAVSEHQDHENGKHCKNRKCLMYHQVDTHDYPSFLVKKDPPKLDEACIAALKAMGGK
jgi:predicted Zn-dependent protease